VYLGQDIEVAGLDSNLYRGAVRTRQGLAGEH
jgi:hypothetical protein